MRDLGTNSKEPPVDYPKIAQQVARMVASGSARFGIMIDGAGIGSAMTANKIPGVLAAAAYNEALARNSREHNDANVLTLGAGQVDVETAKRIVDVFLTTECTADRHQKRVNMIRDIEKGRRDVTAPSTKDLSPEDVARIADRVREILSQSGGSAPSLVLTPDQVVKLIDHTVLKPEATEEDIEKLCKEAAEYKFYSVCVNPSWVAKSKHLLRGTSVKVCAVAGFPLGAQAPQIKALEARRALREGAAEIDMVINIGALKGKDDQLVARDIRGVVEECKEARGICKVILETSLLTDEEKVRACLLVHEGRRRLRQDLHGILEVRRHGGRHRAHGAHGCAEAPGRESLRRRAQLRRSGADGPGRRHARRVVQQREHRARGQTDGLRKEVTGVRATLLRFHRQPAAAVRVVPGNGGAGISSRAAGRRRCSSRSRRAWTSCA